MKAEKVVRNVAGTTRIIYPPDQIEKIVGEIETEEIGVNEVLSRYSISLNTLKRWVKTYGKSDSLPSTFKHFPVIQKRQILIEIETGKLSVLEAIKRYKITERTIYNWQKKYSADIACKNATGNMNKQDQTESQCKEDPQIADLRLKISALETMIDIAEKEFNIPIRKKCGSKQ